MMLRLCAWHPRTFGYPLPLGVTRRGSGISHGMCWACGDAQRQRLGLTREAPPVLRELGRALGTLVCVLIAGAVLLWIAG